VAAAGRAPLLQLEVNRLKQENERVQELAQRVDEAEARYAQLRGMLGANVVPPVREGEDSAARAPAGERLYVGPPIFARAPDVGTGADSSGPTVPSRWPLTVRSYRTRGLAAGDSLERHAGLDLAVPVGSDVRASGGGFVGATGNDSAYGLFVMLRHPDGYETMYGHLSRVLVAPGDRVREGQVIALTGNSGRSTAPHLHFEVRRGGRSVDPLSLVREVN
jgi:murein DD-endopeptidase MepM/ murein hydrolase activator NlpD